MKQDRVNYVRCGRIAAAIAVFLGTVLFLFGNDIASAVSSKTNTQVTVNYYTGMPQTLESYGDAYLNGDSNVGKVIYSTKSLGRMQWGEANPDGTYDVYYDAADVHHLAAQLNEAGQDYETLYEEYVKAYKSVMQ